MWNLFGVVVFHRSMVSWRRGAKLEGDFSSKLEGDSASKLEGESASKHEGALLLGTRCHCMNTSSKNMKSFQVCPLDVTHQGGKLEGDSAGTLEDDSGSKLEGDSGSKLEGDSGS